MAIQHTAMMTVLTAALAAQQRQEMAPDVTFKGADGIIKLNDYRGKRAVVLLFMRGFAKGMTCYYCGEQTRDYSSKYADFSAAGAEVIMVLPRADDIAGFVRKVGESGSPPQPKLKLPFPVVLDVDGSACAAFQVPTKAATATDPFPVEAPTTVVVTKNGEVLFAYHGADPSDRPEAAKILEVLHTGKAPAPAGKPVHATAPARAWANYQDGMRVAKAQRRPILLEFHAVW